MTKKIRVSGTLLVLALILSPFSSARFHEPAFAQSKPSGTLQNDPDFAEFVKKATTKPEFLSPLVDHLPKKAGVPSPKDVLGYHIGTEKRLTYVADQQRYFRALEKALPGRVRTEVVGKTEEGRDIMVLFVSSEANIKNLEANRQNMRKIADPRGLTDAQVQQLIASTKPHYHISAGLHSGETNPPEAVIELAYRLAVSDEPYINQIRDHVVVSIMGATDVDGRDRYVDWYYAYKIDELYDGGENYGGPPYWGKYVFHDNNRDINYGVDSLRVHLNWYLNWVPPIWHDVHEAQTLLYTFSGQPPQNANLDPILYTELPFFATYEVNKLTSFGMPGVWHFGFVDMWSPGYLGFAAANHNGMLRMYEVFNQGGANTKKARLQGNQLTRQWYRPNPATAGEVDWSIRNSINYAQSGLLTALELTSKFPQMVVENYYKKSANAVKRGADKPPHAFVIPAGQRDQSQVDRVANLLRRQAIEVHRSTAEIKVKEGTFPAGSYVVKLNQPYGPLAKTLIEKQTYPDPALNTYDDSAWSMGMANNIDIKTIEDKSILDAPATLLTADIVTAGSVTGTGPVTIVKHNGALNLITLRYRLKDIAMKAAKASFKIGDVEYPAGSLIVETAADRVKKEIESLGLVATAAAAAPAAETVPVDLPRVAMYTTWANTEKVGWVRLAFDRWEVPFDLIHKDHVQAGANLRGKYDVIVMPHQTNNGKSIVYEQPKLSKPLPYKKNDKFKSLGLYAETDDVRGGMGLAGAAEFQKFVEEGGVLVTMGVASAFPAEFGIAKGVEAQSPAPGFYAPGPYVQSEILMPAHPVMFGYNQKTLPVRFNGGPLLQAGPPQGFEQFAGSSPDRPQIVARFTGGEAGVLSGLMRNPDQIRNRPMVVDAPSGKGRVILFANNPIYRWQTFGEHAMIFNTLLFWNDMAGVPAAAKPNTTAQ
ncbi:MAG TPA: M14 family zinc carboxypeptidase [Vicinamibacterales bacterium]|nr:M14 family zinc carboxypeptidase [Vicinamibacterales bacterium]